MENTKREKLPSCFLFFGISLDQARFYENPNVTIISTSFDARASHLWRDAPVNPYGLRTTISVIFRELTGRCSLLRIKGFDQFHKLEIGIRNINYLYKIQGL